MCPGVCHDPGLRRGDCLDLADVTRGLNGNDGMAQPRPVIIKADLASRGDLFHQAEQPAQSKPRWFYATQRFVAASATAVGLGSLVTMGPVVAAVAEASGQPPNDDIDGDDPAAFLETEASGEAPITGSGELDQVELPRAAIVPLPDVSTPAIPEPVASETDLEDHIFAIEIDESAQQAIDEVLASAASLSQWLAERSQSNASDSNRTEVEPRCVDASTVDEGDEVLWCVDDVAVLSGLDSLV